MTPPGEISNYDFRGLSLNLEDLRLQRNPEFSIWPNFNLSFSSLVAWVSISYNS
jgi:hypothetical protein